MSIDSNDLPNETDEEIGSLIQQFHAAGWSLAASSYEASSFGNWYVDLARDGVTIRLVKERSRYFVDDVPRDVLEPAGLWKAFDRLDEFTNAVTAWALRC
jgi:hypothetical protein